MSDGRGGGSGGMGGPGGGFGEAFDEQALSRMMTQVGQQSGGSNSPGGAGGPSGAGGQMPQLPPQLGPTGQAPTGEPQKPREVGSLTDELIKRPVQDIGNELKTFFDLNRILDIPDPSKDPQVLARKRQTMQRYNSLTTEVQQLAKKKYQERQALKQQEEQQKAQAEAQKKAQYQDIVVPSSSQKGPVGPSGSKKQKAVTKLQNDRQTLSGPSNQN